MIIIINRKYLTLLSIILKMLIVVFISSTLVVITPYNPPYTDSYKNNKSYIAIIINDLGNNGDGTEELLKLHLPLTAAVIPFNPYSRSDAEAAHNAGYDVILHIPMEAKHGKPEWLGPRSISADLSDEQIKKDIIDGLNEIKWAISMNNHMGSKATEDERVMRAIFQIVKAKHLFFIDSLTTENSATLKIAPALGVKYFTRDLFLDEIRDEGAIEEKLLQLGEIAKRKGFAIGIGHVGPAGGETTIKAIKDIEPILRQDGIHFVKISTLERIKH